MSADDLSHKRSILRGRRLKSQYPANSPENHVEYILVASFDIDRGSIMEHQYPGPISGDENMLAELMLPDQAHVRSQDWTIFFLHKDTSSEDQAKAERRERRRRRRERREQDRQGNGNTDRRAADDDNGSDGALTTSDESSDSSEDETSEPPLIYVLNLVNTKQDNSLRRGALVKAMAICTRHSFLHIYKPLLLLALEEYFRAPLPETLAFLYNAVNSMDLSLMPRLSHLEKHILQASDARDMFIEKFDYMIQRRMAEDAARGTKHSVSESKQRYALPRDTHEFESRVLYNGIPVPIKVPTAIWPEMVGDFSLIKLIQAFSGPHNTSPQPFALHPHLTTNGAYTHPIIVLVNALLTQKRIIFLGHNCPSGEVAEAVLAACALASGGLLRGFTRHAFPYTDLTKIDELLKVPGFIAGVTNPAFAHKAEWWDLLCDIPTGRMKISNRIENPPVAEGLLYFQQLQSQLPPASAAALAAAGIGGGPTTSNSGNSSATDYTGDAAFMEALNLSISNRHGESAIRAAWRSWVLKFTRIAAAFEEMVFGASALYIGAHETDAADGAANRFGVSGHGFVWPDEGSRLRELAANVHRVEGWRVTRSYYSFVQDLGTGWTKRPVRGIDFLHQADRLRSLKPGQDGSAAIYLAFAKAVEDAGNPDAAEEMFGDDDGPGLIKDGEDLPSSSEQQQQQRSRRLSPRHRAEASSLRQYDTILQLLSVMPESQNGLFYLSLGLFHPRADVRAAVVRLLDRVRTHEAGRHFWAALGRFAKLAFFRVKREEEGDVGGAKG